MPNIPSSPILTTPLASTTKAPTPTSGGTSIAPTPAGAAGPAAGTTSAPLPTTPPKHDSEVKLISFDLPNPEAATKAGGGESSDTKPAGGDDKKNPEASDRPQKPKVDYDFSGGARTTTKTTAGPEGRTSTTTNSAIVAGSISRDPSSPTKPKDKPDGTTDKDAKKDDSYDGNLGFDVSASAGVRTTTTTGSDGTRTQSRTTDARLVGSFGTISERKSEKTVTDFLDKEP